MRFSDMVSMMNLLESGRNFAGGSEWLYVVAPSLLYGRVFLYDHVVTTMPLVLGCSLILLPTSLDTAWLRIIHKKRGDLV